MKVYIAAPWQLREDAKALGDRLTTAGIEITARWLTEPDGQSDLDGAVMDLEDIDRSDALILLNPAEWAAKGTGGRHFECGYAHARGQRSLGILGVRSNVFHHLFTLFADETELLECLQTS